MLRGFAPIIDKNVKVLILGSFPSTKSLEVKEYYGNKGNDFWRVFGRVIEIGEDLHSASYDLKKIKLLEYHMGLWDVFAEAERVGSADSNFRNVIYNDFKTLFKEYPNIKIVLITGNKAYDSYDKLNIPDKSYYKIPSTSGVNRKIDADGKARLILEILKKNNIHKL
jgi:hypoxanthine-DNA glycosylase